MLVVLIAAGCNQGATDVPQGLRGDRENARHLDFVQTPETNEFYTPVYVQLTRPAARRVSAVRLEDLAGRIGEKLGDAALRIRRVPSAIAGRETAVVAGPYYGLKAAEQACTRIRTAGEVCVVLAD